MPSAPPSASPVPSANPAKPDDKDKPKKDDKKDDKKDVDWCAKCITSAQRGAIGGAADAYQRCSDAGKSKTCQGLAKTSAPGAVSKLAKDDKCPQAKGVAAAARAMGAGSGTLDKALGKCK